MLATIGAVFLFCGLAALFASGIHRGNAFVVGMAKWRYVLEFEVGRVMLALAGLCLGGWLYVLGMPVMATMAALSTVVVVYLTRLARWLANTACVDTWIAYETDSQVHLGTSGVLLVGAATVMALSLGWLLLFS